MDERVAAVREAPSLVVLVGVYSELGFWNLPAHHVARLREAFPEHIFLHATTHADTMAMIGDADVVFMSELRSPQFNAARKVRWIHSPAAGVGGMLSPELVASPVILTNSRGLGATAIAEHVLAVTLAMFRHLPMVFANQQQRRWAQAEAFGPPAPRTIAGTRVLVIGLGSIGSVVAQHFVALGATVTGLRRRPSAGEEHPGITVSSTAELHDLLPHHDVVVI
ncbi:MAG TPA: NAD(P)-dependent oxidoreductase, partial [Vicinamibacterales bacterium]